MTGLPAEETDPPFRAALHLAPAGPDRWHAQLGPDWAVGGRAHGGFLLALLAKSGVAALGSDLEPVAVSAEFLRSPEPGPVQLTTNVVKRGRTASVVTVGMQQQDRPILTATVTAGRLPDPGPPDWADLPTLPAEPPANAVQYSENMRRVVTFAKVCDLALEPETAVFAHGQQGPARMRGWVRPHGEPPDVLFALLATDALPPTTLNLGHFGWTPTVQLTAVVRGRPAPGWLGVDCSSRTLAGGWFDEDALVIDAAGRLVCQMRQLALVPR